MSKTRQTGILIGTAVIAMAALWTFPVAGSEAPAVVETTVSEPVDVALDRKIADASPSNAMAWSGPVHRKSKQSKTLRSRAARVAALSASDCNWSGPWCGRQFVLIIGIGY